MMSGFGALGLGNTSGSATRFACNPRSRRVSSQLIRPALTEVHTVNDVACRLGHLRQSLGGALALNLEGFVSRHAQLLLDVARLGDSAQQSAILAHAAVSA